MNIGSMTAPAPIPVLTSPQVPALPSAPVLTSWKDIARYMGKGVRTVQRWEQDFGLPVRRPHGSSKKAILARPSDLDAWVALRCSSRAQLVPDGLTDGNPAAAGTRKPPAFVRTLSELNAQILTSRLLRSSNRELMAELRVALARLQSELSTTCPRPLNTNL